MASDDSKPDENAPDSPEAGARLSDAERAELTELSEEKGADTEVVLDAAEKEQSELVAAQLGSQKYVHAAFFVAGILAAFICGKVFLAAWNNLADLPAAVRALPQLIQYTEEERGSFSLVGGAVVGFLIVLRYYKKPNVRTWATEVAAELSRVTWPDKETVTNGTLVVLVAATVATVYVALLDRFWGYLTNLVYGT